MDLLTLATTVITFLALKSSEGFLQKVGERAYQKVEELVQTVRRKFQGDAYAEQTLERLEQKPQDEARKAALQGVLAEKVEEDHEFMQALQKLVEEIKQAGGDQVMALGERSVAIGGDVTGSTIITGDRNVVGSGNVTQVVKAEGGSTISGVTQTAGEAKKG